MTAEGRSRRVLNSRSEYRRAVQRAGELRSEGALAESNEELAELEGAIARYAARPGKPDVRKGRPSESGSKVV